MIPTDSDVTFGRRTLISDSGTESSCFDRNIRCDGLPDWLISCFRVALLGEIYSQIRAIAVRYSEDKDLLIRFYLDRHPTELDQESIEVVATNLDATAPSKLLNEIDLECLFSEEILRDVDPLDGFIYARREYGLGGEAFSAKDDSKKTENNVR